VKNQKKIKKKEELSAPTRRRRPLVLADHRVGPLPPPTSPIGEEDRTGERREYFVGRKEKREKGNERMRRKRVYTPFIVAHKPTQRPMNRPGSVSFKPNSLLFISCLLLAPRSLLHPHSYHVISFSSCISNTLAIFLSFLL